MPKRTFLSLGLLSVLFFPAGCFTIKTEHEVKPIQITVDVNLKVQRELDDLFGEIDAASTTLDVPEAAPENEG